MPTFAHERLRRMKVSTRFVEPKPDWRINALMWSICGFSFLAVVIVALAAWFRP